MTMCFSRMQAFLRWIFAIVLFAGLIFCNRSYGQELPIIVDELLAMQTNGKVPEAPAETLATHAEDFVDALEHAAGQSILVPIVEYHMAALEALKFLVAHIDEAERQLPPELEKTLTRVALYEGSYGRVEMVYELLDELNTLNDATVTFLMEEATGERQHVALWRTIAIHANDNNKLLLFLKYNICLDEKTTTGNYARMVLKDIRNPDEALLECVLNSAHMPIISIAKYIIENTSQDAKLRAELESKLLDIIFDVSLDGAQREQSFFTLVHNFSGTGVLQISQEILQSPDNPEFLLILAIRHAKHEGLNKIPNIEALLEEIVAKSSEGASKEAAAALEWLR